MPYAVVLHAPFSRTTTTAINNKEGVRVARDGRSSR